MTTLPSDPRDGDTPTPTGFLVPDPPHRRRRWPWIVAAGMVAAAVAAGAVTYILRSDTSTPAPATAATPTVRAVSGKLTLDDPDGFSFGDGSGCAGSGGYDDIRPGAQVVITDKAGETVGLGKLGDGMFETGPGEPLPHACTFTFLVEGVPTGRGFYGVEVSRRGRVQYPERELFGAFALTLG
ncbi:hypothetical protein [Micromonospora aurantiaca (nom. illeg.)]|uniref:hypothetical protein n=1 Tax=Micromonospora aurantiaca (nom. illeg.) TaxID=47850 RepID=UPI00343748BA